MAAARETLQQSTDVVTPDAALTAADRIASLHLRIMELQEERWKEGNNRNYASCI